MRIDILYTGLCYTDVAKVREEWGPNSQWPLIPGHEIIGKVSLIGSEVKGYTEGDIVGFGARRDCCEECEFCKSNYEQLCSGKLE